MIFDAHSDIWTDVTIRSLQGETDILKRHHLPRLREGQVEGAIFVIWIDPPNDADPAERSRQIMAAAAKEIAVCDEIAVVHNYAEMAQARAAGKFYIFLGLEGLKSIGEDLSQLDVLHEFGARHAGLTWNEQNPLATGVQGDPARGLTKLGRAAVKKIQEMNMLLDVSHLNEKSFWDLTDVAQAPVIASHSNAKALCPASRNLTDSQLLTIRDMNGVVGLNSFNLFVSQSITEQTLDNLVKHAVYIADKIGVDHLGFGFDFFEFLSTESMRSYSDQETSYTTGFEDCTKIPRLLEQMKQAGFTERELEMVSCENFHRVIKEVLK